MEFSEHKSYAEIIQIKNRVMSMFHKIHSLKGEDVVEKTTNTQKIHT